MNRRSFIALLIVLGLGVGAIAGRAFYHRLFKVSEQVCESVCVSCYCALSTDWISHHMTYGTFLTAQIPKSGGGVIGWKELLDIPLSHTEGHFRFGGSGHLTMVTGHGTIGEGSPHLRLEDISDGWENTLAIIELPGDGLSDDRWVIDIDDLDRHLTSDGNLAALDIHTSGRGLMFIDGGIYRQLKPLSKDQLRALMTVAGGEPLTRADLVEKGYLRHRNYGTEADD